MFCKYFLSFFVLSFYFLDRVLCSKNQISTLMQLVRRFLNLR